MKKTDEEKLAELEAAEARLNERKKRIRQKISTKNRKEDTRRKVLVGAVVLAHAEHDEGFNDLLWTILKNRTIREPDREFLGLKPLSEADKKRIRAQEIREGKKPTKFKDNNTEKTKN